MKFICSIIVCLSLCTAAVAQQGKTTKDVPKNKNYTTLTERISGQWKLDRITDAAQKNGTKPQAANSEATNNGMQIVEFLDNSRYKLNSSTTAVDSGNYVLNERNQSLILQSDRAGNSATEWDITLKGQELTLVPREEADKRYRYHYTRTKSTVRK